MVVEYHPAAVRELEEIRDYYEARSEGLGRRSVNEFESHMAEVAEMPGRWMILSGDIRRAPMRRFPYLILFRIVDQGRLRVTVINHERRHPALGLYRR